MAVEEFLGQIRIDGVWKDYSRGTEEAARRWFEEAPANRRVVDWIDKHRVLYPKPTPEHIALRQDADGTPYFAYFDPETQAGFCWSGDPAQSVEVAYGGMGEPVADTFKMQPIAFLSGPRNLLAEFKRQCDAHLITRSRKD